MKSQTALLKPLIILTVTIIIVSCDTFLSPKPNQKHQAIQSHSFSPSRNRKDKSFRKDPLLVKQYRSTNLPDSKNTLSNTLLNLVNKEGKVPIIIRLDVPFTPEGLLTKQEIQRQRQKIQKAQNNLLSVLALQNVTAIKRYQYIPFLAMHVNSATLTLLKTSQYVLNVVKDKAQPPSLMDSIPLIGADKAWASGFTGEGYTIGILDTGVDTDHPFFDNRIVDQACFSTTNKDRDVETLCPNGKDKDLNKGAGNSIDPSIAGYKHGTYIAGIAAGHGSDFSGVAKGAQIITVQIYSEFDNDNNCGAASTPCVLSYMSDQMRALEWIYKNRSNYDISSVNMSLGSGRYIRNCDDDNPLKSAIDNLRSSYIATVLPSGNHGYTNALSQPACISTAISVGSTTKSDHLSSFSNIASFLDLLAPGSSIKSSIPGGDFGTASGTSGAAAHVAGSWAVVRQANPAANVAEVLNKLVKTGKSITTGSGITKPRIQVDAAVANPRKRQIIYDDRLADPWIDVSWNASVNFSSEQQVYSGSQSIRVDQKAWGSLSLRNESWNSTVGLKHKRMVFRLYSKQETKIDLKLENDAGDSFPRLRYGSVKADKWTQVSVSMSQLNPHDNTVNRIDILESSGTSETYYVDNLRLMDKKPASTPESGSEVLPVYNDRLSDPWIDASWNSTTDYADTQYSFAGDHSIRVTQGAWGGLSMHHGSWNSPVPIKADDYGRLTLAVFAPNNSLVIDLQLSNKKDDHFPKVPYGTVSRGKWITISMPISKLDPDSNPIDRVNILETSGASKTYYVDKVRFANNH